MAEMRERPFESGVRRVRRSFAIGAERRQRPIEQSFGHRVRIQWRRGVVLGAANGDQGKHAAMSWSRALAALASGKAPPRLWNEVLRDLLGLRRPSQARRRACSTSPTPYAASAATHENGTLAASARCII